METGNKFAIDKSREKMAKLIVHNDPEEQEQMRAAWKSIHMDLCAFAMVGNSKQTKVNVDLSKRISTKVNLRIVKDFPWAQIKE